MVKEKNRLSKLHIPRQAFNRCVDFYEKQRKVNFGI